MNLDTAIKELGTAAGTISGLRVYPWAAKAVTPPGLIFALPQDITPNETYARGGMRIKDLPAILLVGAAASRTSLAALSAYCAGSGAKSLVTAWQNYAGYTQIQAINIPQIELVEAKLAGTDYLAAIFHLDVIGSGTT
jgi:hypothetical protein